MSVCTFLDLKKAFDTVHHTILLDKCCNISLRGHVFNILKSYLTNSSQFVQIAEVVSSTAFVDIGVPQASVLGPLLFIIYVNDLSNTQDVDNLTNLESNIILFADDTVIETSATTEEVVMRHKTQLQKCNQWLTNNKLTINTEKTKSMFFGKIKTHPKKEQINIDKERIENVDSIRYLGITIDNKLSFKNHIDVVNQKLIKFIGLFYRLRKFLSKSQMIQVFKSYVQPVVQYGILTYGNSVLSDRLKIKKLIRIIFNKRKFNSVSDLRRKFNLFLAKELHLYEVLKLLIKMLRDECVVSHVKSYLNDNELNRVKKKEEKQQCVLIAVIEKM